MNRKAALNLLVHAATESRQQWAREIKGMRMGILIVIHTFGADMKWHPHIHLIVTGADLSLAGKRWIGTDPKFLLHHAGISDHQQAGGMRMAPGRGRGHLCWWPLIFKKRWKYQVTTRMKRAHREGQWRFPKSKDFLKQYPCVATMLNKLWSLTWWAYIGASLVDPRFSIQYIGRPLWAERQTDYTGINPLQCPNCNKTLTFVGCFFGNWNQLQQLFVKAGKDATIAAALLRPG